MTKLTRLTGKVFGENASPTGDASVGPYIGQFGSAKTAEYKGTGDVAEIQAKSSAWANGWIDAVTPQNQFPPLPEMTGVDKVLSYQECYILQRGIPEWDSATDYHTDCYCSYQGTIYQSIIDNNVNIEPGTDDTAWMEYGLGSQDYANQDLSNLTAVGNARFTHIPFSINSGSITNGENTTLILPGGSQTTIDYENPYLIENGTFGGSNMAVESDYPTRDTSSVYGKEWNLFDGNPDTFCVWYPTSETKYVNLDAYFPVAVKPTEIKIQVYCSYMYGYPPNYIILYGSNDRANWDNLGQVTTLNTADKSIHTISPVTNNYYTYLRFYLYAAGQTAAGIAGNEASLREITIKGKNLLSSSDTIICQPCEVTNCEGKTSIFNGEYAVNISDYPDGKYCIFKNCVNGDLVLTDSFSIGKTNPNNTDYWLDISTIPAQLKINGIINNDLVKIGSCEIGSGIIVADVYNNQFNMNGYFELSNLPDYSRTISVSGSPYIAEYDGWIIASDNSIVRPIYMGDSFSLSTGQHFVPMKGY